MCLHLKQKRRSQNVASPHAILDAGYCYRRRNVAWSVCLSVCLPVRHDRELYKNGWPLEMLLESRLVWALGTIIRLGWTSSPPNEYDGSICAAAMRAVATTTVATCSSCRRARMFFFLSGFCSCLYMMCSSNRLISPFYISTLGLRFSIQFFTKPRFGNTCNISEQRRCRTCLTLFH